jgi:hypothetical protein
VQRTSISQRVTHGQALVRVLLKPHELLSESPFQCSEPRLMLSFQVLCATAGGICGCWRIMSHPFSEFF